MNFDKILTVDESFLDVSLSYTFNDAVIFYHALFEMQNTGNMGVYIRFEDLKQYFTTEDIKILERTLAESGDIFQISGSSPPPDLYNLYR